VGSEDPTTPGGIAAPVANSYRFAGQEHTTPQSVAKAFAENWGEATRELEGDDLRRWAETGLGDPDLARFIAGLQDEPGQSPDARLFRLIRRLDPSAPPTYMGYPITEEGLTGVAAQVAGPSPTRQTAEMVFGLFRDRVLTLHAESSGQQRFAQIDQRWHDEFADWQKGMADAREGGGPDIAAASSWKVRARLLLATVDPAAEAELRNDARKVASARVSARPWFSGLGNPDSAGIGALAAMDTLGREIAVRGDPQQSAEDAEVKRKKRRRIRLGVLAGLIVAIVAVVLLTRGGGGTEAAPGGANPSGAASPGATTSAVPVKVLYTAGLTAPENMLKDPKDGADLVTKLPKGSVVEILSEQETDWYQVRLKDQPDTVGWVPRERVNILCNGTCSVGS